MTKHLYKTNSYTTSFNAKVLSQKHTEGICEVILDETYFYPEGGGQGPDYGTIQGFPVVNIQKQSDGTVIHFVEIASGEKLPENIRGEIDWNRRFSYMQVHSGQHMFSAAMKEVGNFDTLSITLRINGFCDATFDSTNISETDLTKAEELVNTVIWENKSIECFEVTKEEIANYTLRRPVKEKIWNNFSTIRIVNIGNFDIVACGGTHVQNTGEVGLIKVIDFQTKGTHTTVRFTCGKTSLQAFQHANILNKKFALFQKVKYTETHEKFTKHLEELELKHKSTINLKKQISNLQIDFLLRQSTKIGNIQVISHIFQTTEHASLKDIAENILQKTENTIVLLAHKNLHGANIFLTCSDSINININKIFQEKRPLLKGKGGGRSNFVQGMVEEAGHIPNELFEPIIQEISNGNDMQ